MCVATLEDFATSQYGTMMGLHRIAPTSSPWRAFDILLTPVRYSVVPKIHHGGLLGPEFL
jgi:hypothetical protein